MQCAAGLVSSVRCVCVGFVVTLSIAGFLTGSAHAQSGLLQDQTGKNTGGFGRPILVDGTDAADTLQQKPWWLERTEEGVVPGAGAQRQPEDDVLIIDDLGATRSLGEDPALDESGAVGAGPTEDEMLQQVMPGSRIARIAAYKAGLEALVEVRQELDQARRELELMTPPATDIEVLRANHRDVRTRMRALGGEVARLDQILSDSGGADADAQKALDQAQIDLAAAVEERQTARAALELAVAYRDAVENVAELQLSLVRAEVEALELLADASDKPLTNDVIAEVNRLLGLEDVVLVLPDVRDDTAAERAAQ